MKDSNIHIAEVGKRLVFYKNMKVTMKRANVSLSSKEELEKYLQKNAAILLPA